MSENNVETKLPSQIIFENLKEFLRAKNAAHESIFKAVQPHLAPSGL